MDSVDPAARSAGSRLGRGLEQHYSAVTRLWLPGLVERVYDDNTLEISYYAHPVGTRYKDLPRSDPELRPFRPVLGKG